MTLASSPNRVVVFIDGQNTYLRLLETYTDLPRPMRYDVVKLANLVVGLATDRALTGIRFYTGIQNSAEDPKGYAGKQKYLAGLQSNGVVVKQHTMKYGDEWRMERVQPVPNTCCQPRFGLKREAREKGIDILLALDLVLMANTNDYDTAVILSQDTDLDVAVNAAQKIAEGRFYIAVENAFLAEARNKARLANTVPRPLTRAMLQANGVIELPAAPLTLTGIAP